MAAIVIKTEIERENFYRFCRILVDIGSKIARGYQVFVKASVGIGYKDRAIHRKAKVAGLSS